MAAVMADAAFDNRPRLVPTATQTAFVWLHRVAAAICLLFGALYWVRLVGYYDGPLWRFDLMPAHWQVAALGLSVLLPFAGIGLWMMASWGPVIWFLAAGSEAVMYGLFPDLFGTRPGLLGLHAAIAVLYAVLRVALLIQKRRDRTKAAAPVY